MPKPVRICLLQRPLIYLFFLIFFFGFHLLLGQIFEILAEIRTDLKRRTFLFFYWSSPTFDFWGEIL